MKPMTNKQINVAAKYNLSAKELGRVRRFQEYKEAKKLQEAKQKYLAKNTRYGQIKERLSKVDVSKGFKRYGGRVSKRSSNTLISIFTGGRR